MRKVTTLVTVTILMAFTSSAFAGKVNPYNYSKHKNASNDAKWQRGHSSEQRCYSTGCESTMNSSSNQKYIWADDNNSQLHFSTDGNQDSDWRSELRFNSNFFRGSNRTLTARFGYWAGRSTSKGFTVAQLHMDGNEGWTKAPLRASRSSTKITLKLHSARPMTARVTAGPMSVFQPVSQDGKTSSYKHPATT